MNGIKTKFQVVDHIPAIVPRVFQTMMGAEVTVTLSRPFTGERISGAIGIAGETVTGTVYLHLPLKLAEAVTRAILQMPATEPIGDTEINDVVGELSNMVGAGLKSQLNDADYFCAVSTPSVIRGSFVVEAMQGATTDLFYFECLGQRLAVEVHLNLDQATTPTL
jgi:CheY-specific phosphatase CheX